MCESGFTLSSEVLQSILQICEETYDYILVHQIYSIICRHHLELNGEICRCLVQFCVRIKDFEGAYKMVDNLREMNLKPTTAMYNAIMAGYFREVVLDPRVPLKSLNDIKSVLVSTLASHGQLSEALLIYEEIKKAGHNLEPKAVISLIEELVRLRGELKGLLLLLEELSDLDYWVDGCFSSAIVLFKQLKEKFENDELVTEVLFDAAFSIIAASECGQSQFGLDLLWAIKNELGLVPSGLCLDFLLSACANAGDLNNACLIWREYEVAEFLYNVLSYLRMYQALLASGDHRSANLMLKKIPRDDTEVCSVVFACQETYCDKLNSVEGKMKKQKGKKKKEKEKE